MYKLFSNFSVLNKLFFEGKLVTKSKDKIRGEQVDSLHFNGKAKTVLYIHLLNQPISY